MNETKMERFRSESVEPQKAFNLIKKMDDSGYVCKKFTPTSEVSHLERYKYLTPKGEKLAIVYDTSAKILSVDGAKEVIAELKRLFENAEKPIKQIKKQKQLSQTNKPKADKPIQKTENPPKNKVKNKPQKKTEAVKPIIIKGVSAKRLDWIIKDLKESDGVKAKITTAPFDKTKAVTLTAKNKETIKLIRDESGNVKLIGKSGELLTHILAQLESRSDVRLLKKYLPTAMRYLSESSKIDLSNGLTDINNVGRLSDYSVLLIPPYRALEKFIFDLQQAENIKVKMIGQAYEKDENGKYSLKKGYLKKINSVVYAEVMSALYTEYSETRNFYTHSDNLGANSRGISDKAETQKLLARLLSIIEYNAKKLSEIGFTTTED